MAGWRHGAGIRRLLRPARRAGASGGTRPPSAGRVRSRVALALGLLAMLTLAGCWDESDPKTLDVVESLGFTQGAGQGYDVLAQVPTAAFLSGLLPGSAGGGGASSGPLAFVTAASGVTVPMAVAAMDRMTGKSIYLGQTRVYFVDAGLARAGLTGLVDQMQQMAMLPRGIPLVVIDGPLQPLLQAKLAGTTMAGRFIDLYFRSTQGRDLTKVPLWSLFVALDTPGTEPTLPVFRMATAGDQPTMEAEGTGVFLGGRMVSILTGVNNRGLQFWTNSVDGQVIAVPSPVGPVTIDTVGSHMTFAVRVARDAAAGVAPVLQAQVRVTGAIRIGPPLMAPVDFQQIQDAVSAQVQSDMESAFRALQAAHADAIGAGTWLYYHDPHAFAGLQPWPRTFSRLTLDLRVVTVLQTTGWGS